MKLTQRTIAAIEPVDRLRIFFDDEVRGFGLRVGPPSPKSAAGSRTWVFEYRPAGSGRGTPKRRLKLGDLESLKPDQARDMAKAARAKVQQGEDPSADAQRAKEELTLADAFPEYTAAMARRWKASTAAMQKARWGNHVLPSLGNRKVSKVTPRDVQALHARLSTESPVAANRVVSSLSAFFGWWTRMNPGSLKVNPASGVVRNPEEPRRNYLTAGELRRLFTAIDTAVSEGVPWSLEHGRRGKRKEWHKHTPGEKHRRTFVSANAAAAVKLLAFTGCRLREVLHLQWEHVDFDRRQLILPETKTGFRSIPLSDASLALLRQIYTGLPTDPKEAGFPKPENFVFAETAGGKARADLHRPWRTICRAAGLPMETRIHDLRHSAASLLINSGAGLELVAGVLGHKSVATARRYSHLMDSTVRAAAELIAGHIAPTPAALPAPAEVEEDLIG